MTHKQLSQRPWQVISLIGLLFLIPIILAGLFYTHKTWLPKHTLNHGELISPPYPMRQLALDPSVLHQQWGLMYVHSGPCDSLCQRWLYNMRQIQRALGKDTNRLQRVLLDTQPGSADVQLQKLLKDSQTLFWRADPVLLTRRPGQPAAFYVIDPFGNIILAYTASANPEAMLDDLKFLMGQVG